MGIEPYLMSSSLLAMLAKRLVQRSATIVETKQCRKQNTLSGSRRYRLIRRQRFLRDGLGELLTVNGICQSLTQLRVNALHIRKAAHESGLTLFANDELAKMADWKTMSA